MLRLFLTRLNFWTFVSRFSSKMIFEKKKKMRVRVQLLREPMLASACWGRRRIEFHLRSYVCSRIRIGNSIILQQRWRSESVEWVSNPFRKVCEKSRIFYEKKSEKKEKMSFTLFSCSGWSIGEREIADELRLFEDGDKIAPCIPIRNKTMRI